MDLILLFGASAITAKTRGPISAHVWLGAQVLGVRQGLHIPHRPYQGNYPPQKLYCRFFFFSALHTVLWRRRAVPGRGYDHGGTFRIRHGG